ncbi:C-C motif chemokine 4-like isoform X3 [Centroberyx affinis]|uniref:C-C motif chemokine 4-like isoform X3 n=1 Tax=Centroberyx affinis TaxID=166261 RepID=UPI003A5C56A8
MKTLCLTLGLLLLSGCCNAVPRAVNVWQPGACCFQFSTTRIPKNKIIDIKKTHSRCLEKGFVVHTAKGKQICYSQSVEWLQTLFNQLQEVLDRQ